MAITLILTDFVNTLDLNPAYSNGQADFKPHEQGFQFGQADTAARWHSPTQGLEQLLDLSDRDMFCSFPFRMDGSATTVDRNLTLLRRWIKGEHQQAAMSELDENYRPVYLQFKKDGSTNDTYFRVRLGDIDESAAHITPAKGGNVGRVYRAVANLRFRPWGTTRDPYYVNNAIKGSPNFYRRDANDLPLGVTKIGTPTVETVTDRALIAGRSMHITTASINNGVYMTTDLIPRYHLTITALWLIIITGTWSIQVTDTSNTVIYEQTGLTAANQAASAETSTNDRNEYTWYLSLLEQVIGEIDPEGQYRVRLLCTTSSGEIYTDSWSFQTVDAINLFTDPGNEVLSDRSKSYIHPHAEGWFVDDTVGASPRTAHTDTYFFTGAKATMYLPGTQAYHNALRSLLMDNEVSGYDYTFKFAYHSPVSGSGTDDIVVSLLDGADNVIDATTIDPGSISGYDTAVTGDDSNTWYLYTLSGANDDAPGVRINVQRSLETSGNGGGQHVFDSTYLYRGTGPSFNRVQVFGRRIVNANETSSFYTNYVDIFNVPGDLDAALEMRLRFGVNVDASGRDLMVSKYVERRWPVLEHTYEAEGAAGHFTEGDAGAGTWSMDSTAVSGTSGTGHVRFTGGNGAGGHIYTGFDADKALSWSSAERMPRFRWRTNDTATGTLQFKWVDGTGGVQHAGNVNVLSTANEWVLAADDEAFKLDLSPIAGNYAYLSYSQLQVHVDVTSGGTVDIDYWEPVPAGDGNYMRVTTPYAIQGSTFIIDGDREEVVQQFEGRRLPGTGSGVWTAAHGYAMTRYVFAWINSTGIHDVTGVADVDVGIKPRSRLFLSDI